LAKDIAQITPKSIVLLFPLCVSALFEEENLECLPLGSVEIPQTGVYPLAGAVSPKI
jgi:hypothetical protein